MFILNAFENLFDAWQFPLTFKPAVGAVLLGVMAFLYPYLAGTIPVSSQEMRLGLPLVANLPHVFGSGFPFLEKVLQGQASFWLLAMLIFLKPLATPNPVTVFPDEPVWAAINKMTPLGFARLPVVSRQAERRIVGLISRSDILRAYEVGLMRKRHIQYIRDRMALRKVSGVEFMELTVTDACESKGKWLAKMKLPPNTNVVSIEREGILLIPDNKTTILPKDRITVFCHTEWANEVKKIFSPGRNKS